MDAPTGWRPSCAICVLCGFGSPADTLIRETPVCVDHADLLMVEGLNDAVKIAREDVARPGQGEQA